MLECLRWAKSVWENVVTQETITNCFKKAGFKKQPSEQQDEPRATTAQNEDFDIIFERLAHLQHISANDRNLINDSTAIDKELVTSPILSNSDIAKKLEMRDTLQQMKRSKMMKVERKMLIT